jgi:mono/diheme cytochrome c family protein
VFDGIEEFDNRLPNWWMWIMYGSIVFAVLYWIVFHTLEVRPLPREKFEIEMLAAQEAELERMAKSGVSNESLMLMAGMQSTQAEGRELFVKHCVACHLDDGRGQIGPNLTDEYWVHGCEPMDMLKVVNEVRGRQGHARLAQPAGPQAGTDGGGLRADHPQQQHTGQGPGRGTVHLLRRNPCRVDCWGTVVARRPFRLLGTQKPRKL